VIVAGPSIVFTASPNIIGVGHSSTLHWSVPDATSVSLDHGIGPQPDTSSIDVSPESTTLYSLTAIGPSGLSESSVWVFVVPMPAITFTATPQSIQSGKPVMLMWNATNATNVFIDQGVGTVSLVGTKIVAPLKTTTYVMTATGMAGTTQSAVTVNVLPTRIHAVRH